MTMPIWYETVRARFAADVAAIIGGEIAPSEAQRGIMLADAVAQSMRTAPTFKEGDIPCPRCGKTFNSKSAIRAHMQHHA